MSLKLDVSGLDKKYNEKRIIRNFNYQFNVGCYLVQGPNGVGKSVLLELLAGVERLRDGSIVLNKIIPCGSLLYKGKMAYIPSKPSFYPFVTGAGFLRFVKSIRKIINDKAVIKLESLINAYGLTEFLTTPFSEMSMGTKMKFFLSTLALGDFELIILDEPTNGLDDVSKSVFINELKFYSESAIVIAATHDSDVQEKVCHSKIRLDFPSM